MATGASRAPGNGPDPATARRTVLGLLLPADPSRALTLLPVADTSPAFSDAIGGGLLEEIRSGIHHGRAYCLYGDEERVSRRLPANPRAGTLAKLLGWRQQVPALALLGDLLMVGIDAEGQDVDLPEEIIRLAVGAGLITADPYETGGIRDDSPGRP